jgi:hypothetical protein
MGLGVIRTVIIQNHIETLLDTVVRKHVHSSHGSPGNLICLLPLRSYGRWIRESRQSIQRQQHRQVGCS